MEFSEEYIRSVHIYCSNHEDLILKSEVVGCFYCLSVYSPIEIQEWIDDDKANTAICPKCGIDSVLPDKLPVKDLEFLKRMNEFWF